MCLSTACNFVLRVNDTFAVYSIESDPNWIGKWYFNYMNDLNLLVCIKDGVIKSNENFQVIF